MRPKLKDKRLYWRGDRIWCRVPQPPDGAIKRLATGCRNEEAAVARANEFEQRWANPAHATAAAATLVGGIEALLADLRRRQRSAATQKKARQKLGHFLRLWPGCSMRDLEMRGPDMVLQYIDQRLKEDVTRLTVKMELQHLDMVLRLARYLGTFHRDPKELFPPFFTAGHKPRKTKLTPEQALMLRAQLPPSRGAHVAFILATGARASEVETARFEDIGDGYVHLRGTKTEAAEDDVPITAVSRPWLMMALEGRWPFRGGPYFPPTAKLYEPWGNIRRDLTAACKRAGIPRVTPNDLRRTFASWHRDAGVPAELVSKLLRHTTDKLAQTTYAKLGPKETGLLIAGHLRERTSVPEPYATPATPGPSRLLTSGDSPEKEPEEGAHLGIRTPDLRFTKAWGPMVLMGESVPGVRVWTDCSVPELYGAPQDVGAATHCAVAKSPAARVPDEGGTTSGTDDACGPPSGIARAPNDQGLPAAIVAKRHAPPHGPEEGGTLHQSRGSLAVGRPSNGGKQDTPESSGAALPVSLITPAWALEGTLP